MRKLIPSLLATFVVLAVATPARAERPIHSSGRFGIGLGGGTISNGLSAKYYMTAGTAIQANLGSYGNGGDRADFGGFAASADFLLERGPLTTTGYFSLDWSFGLGAGVGVRDSNTGIAAAGVLGLELNFTVIPIDLVLEYRPTLGISPDVDFEPVDFSGHLRFYFM